MCAVTPEAITRTTTAHPSITQPGKLSSRQEKVSQVHRELGQAHTAVVASPVVADLVNHRSSLLQRSLIAGRT